MAHGQLFVTWLIKVMLSLLIDDQITQVQQRAGQIKADADKLTLISVLGRGAWGTVYKGTWRVRPWCFLRLLVCHV